MTAIASRAVSLPSRRIGAGLLALTFALAGCSSSAASPSAPPSAPVSSAASAPASAAATAAPTTGASAAGSAVPSASVDAAAEFDAVIAGLDKANDLYKSGQVQPAMDEIAETYEEHFEHIEGPLETKNSTLKDDLEETIASKIRAAMQANQPAADVEAMIKETILKLQTAKALFA